MTTTKESTEKVHYICQTYTEKKGGAGDRPGLKIDKQFQYATASQAQERAEREYRLQNCIGADAYMVIEDSSSDEVSPPSFLVRLGEFPEFDDF